MKIFRIRIDRIQGFSELKNCPQSQTFILLNLDNPVNPDSDTQKANFIIGD